MRFLILLIYGAVFAGVVASLAIFLKRVFPKKVFALILVLVGILVLFLFGAGYIWYSGLDPLRLDLARLRNHPAYGLKYPNAMKLKEEQLPARGAIQPGESPRNPIIKLSFGSNDSIENVLEFYSSNLQKIGYKKTFSEKESQCLSGGYDSGGGCSVRFIKEGESIKIGLGNRTWLSQNLEAYLIDGAKNFQTVFGVFLYIPKF